MASHLQRAASLARVFSTASSAFRVPSSTPAVVEKISESALLPVLPFRFSGPRFLSTAGKVVGRFPASLSTPIWAPTRAFCSDTAVLPLVTDPDIERALKNVLALNWDDLQESLRSTVMNALSKETDDKSGKEALANAWRAAEAVEQFSGVLETLRMELDEMSGSSGENVRPLPDELQGALQAAYKRYNNYLNAFGPEETYLRKKVENELGTSMIHIKMRCAGLGSEWGKVTLLGTSGISGSYIEQRS